MIFSKLARRMQLARWYSAVKAPVGKPVKNVLAEDATSGHHPNPKLWANICAFVCLPALLASAVNVFMCEIEHHKHHEKPDYKPYEYLKINTKAFPWGDGQHSLFHNPKVNPLKDGYTCPEGLGLHHSH